MVRLTGKKLEISFLDDSSFNMPGATSVRDWYISRAEHHRRFHYMAFEQLLNPLCFHINVRAWSSDNTQNLIRRGVRLSLA